MRLEGWPQSIGFVAILRDAAQGARLLGMRAEIHSYVLGLSGILDKLAAGCLRAASFPAGWLARKHSDGHMIMPMHIDQLHHYAGS
jgi:hypothetical protein